MSKDAKNVPALRFKGYSDAWEKRKLAEVAEINPKSEIPETFRYIDLESVKGSAIINSRSETRQTAPSRAQRTARIGDVFYQTVRPYQRNNVIFLLRTTEPYVFSSGYAQLRSLVNPFFILYLVQTDNFVNRVLNRATGTSYPAINPTHLSNIPVWIPQSFSEQKRVGQLLRRLDNLITATQHKIDALEQAKKALLQCLFDQSWRFKGYSDPWEKRKLKELGDTYSGLSGKTKEDFGHGEARYVTYMNVFTNPVADPVGTETTEIDTRQNEVKKNDVFFTTSSETPGEVGMSSVWPIETKNVYLNSFCFGYRILNQSSLNFLFIAQQMRSPSFRKRIIVLAP
ncbi:restriction endonuclease subunit S [Lacticaseibacillus paracasei]|uniref:restriction endonuclease subunit S n=2 Tax=Lacticaseibacillus paracasei TaxID=1597 RepID=UPI002F25FA03